MAGSRESERLHGLAKKAKEKAGELLKGTVPDPDGELAKQVSTCDEDDD